jgi:hypothetical protein
VFFNRMVNVLWALDQVAAEQLAAYDASTPVKKQI